MQQQVEGLYEGSLQDWAAEVHRVKVETEVAQYKAPARISAVQRGVFGSSAGGWAIGHATCPGSAEGVSACALAAGLTPSLSGVEKVRWRPGGMLEARKSCHRRARARVRGCDSASAWECDCAGM